MIVAHFKLTESSAASLFYFGLVWTTLFEALIPTPSRERAREREREREIKKIQRKNEEARQRKKEREAEKGQQGVKQRKIRREELAGGQL